MRKVKKRLKMSKFEKLIYTLALFLLVISPVSIVFSKATLANINYEVEKQKQKIEEQQKEKDTIQRKIDTQNELYVETIKEKEKYPPSLSCFLTVAVKLSDLANPSSPICKNSSVNVCPFVIVVGSTLLAKSIVMLLFLTVMSPQLLVML